MKITDDMLKSARDAAIAYANEHVRELAEEIIEWQDTAILRDGRLRDLAKMTEIFGTDHSLPIAESFAIRAALDAAGRRTTPDRDAIIEECAKVCDEYAIDRFALFKGRKPYTGREPGRADPYYDGTSDGADRCAQLIREFKTAPTSDKGGA